MTKHQGGCLCGKLRYEVSAAPVRVAYCHCRFCQRATGGAYMVEPIFDKRDFSIIEGEPRTYSQQSVGSGKRVTINFCENCSTKIFLDLERFPEIFGVYGGTFDDPNWFPRDPQNSRHIFLGVGQKGTVVPAGYRTFIEHAYRLDGTSLEPRVYSDPHNIK